MNGRTQSWLLLLFGGALLRLATSGALLRFVRPVARPWVLLAGAAIVVLALTNLLASSNLLASTRRLASSRLSASPRLLASSRRSATSRRSASSPSRERLAGNRGVRSTHEIEVGDLHGHARGPRAAWLVMAPVVAILVISPPALGSYSAARVPVSLARPSQVHFPPLTAGNPAADSLIDFAARALWDGGHTLAGRQVELTGFVLRSTSGGFVLSRLVITCCAADARPIDIGVLSRAPAAAADTWVRVVGTYSGISPTDSTLPMIDAISVTVIRQPTNPYDD
jgi:uncharacterized repeat protein (TIGR03943 family)